MARKKFKRLSRKYAISKRIDKWLASIGRTESNISRNSRKKNVIWAGINSMASKIRRGRNKRSQWQRNEGIKMNDLNGEIFLGANDEK